MYDKFTKQNKGFTRDMNFLDQLSPEQRTLMVSLPYRVGLFISHSDTSGGHDSDEAEMRALSGIISGYSEEVFGSETVQYVISETIARKDEWDEWSKDLKDIQQDCRKAIYILSDYVDEKEVSAYRRHLVEIGESVALAFREYGHSTPLWDKIRVLVYFLGGKFDAFKKGQVYKNWNEFINISLDERRALRYVAAALNVRYI